MVDVPIDLTDEEFLSIARMAHERDITLNQLAEEVLREEIERAKERLSNPC